MCIFNSGLYFYINLQIQENGVINVLGTTDRPFKVKTDDTWDFPVYCYTFFSYSWIRYSRYKMACHIFLMLLYYIMIWNYVIHERSYLNLKMKWLNKEPDQTVLRKHNMIHAIINRSNSHLKNLTFSCVSSNSIVEHPEVLLDRITFFLIFSRFWTGIQE